MDGETPGASIRRVTLVTGGSRGLGAHVASGLAADGDHVIICGRNPPGDVDGVTFIACDVRKAEAVAALIEQVVALHGRLDMVVNNAGGAPMVSAADASPRLSESVIALNLTGPLHVATAANRVMQRQSEGGSIVNISSISGTRPSPGTAAYGAAKAGLLNLTETLAMEWGPSVRVNALVVGLVEMEGGDEHYGSAGARARIAAALPLARMVRGDDVLNAVRFLGSPQATYISGAQIALHGGGERPLFLELAKG
jgi:NAD(P)-dependent dehydrogenase (short-subunit alcohol dehydrogenase family)